MIAKGEKTKHFIIENSIALFAEKGYTAVTMKDVCEKCQMSRGGVYRYFSSTKEIFIGMLDIDIEVNKEIVKENIKNGVSALNIINGYFNQEKKLIFSENNGLYFAIHEFAFAEKDQRENLNRRVKESISIIKDILEHGQETNEFKDFDALEVATHIIYFMDSLKTSASIIDKTEKMIDSQIEILKELII